MAGGTSYLHATADRSTLLAGPAGAVLLMAGGAANGQLSILEHPLAPRALGAPTHVHRSVDEYSVVLEGEVGAEVGGDRLRAGPGDVIAKPRGVPHAFWNPTDEPSLVLEIIVPGGFETYFSELAEVFAPGGPPSPEALEALAARWDMEFDLSSIPRLAGEHGLQMG